MPAVILDEAFFKGWQDDTLQRARRVLRREGKLRPTVIACVSPDIASFGTADSTSFDRMEGRFTNLLQRDADLPREARS